MLEQIMIYIENFLLTSGINIHDKNYKKSEKYREVRDIRIFGFDYGSMSLDEFIERFLLTKNETFYTYESIYDLGVSIDLGDGCEDIDVAIEILNVLESEAIDENDIEAEAVDLATGFKRPGGLIDRMKNYLNFDLEAFDKEDKQYKRERCKILYFFYMLENKYFPKTNILMLLSKPSMENIDNSLIGMQTYNGMITKLIKESFEKELSLSVKNKIKKSVEEIVSTWDNILDNANILMDFFCENGHEYDFEETICILSPGLEENEIKTPPKYTLSPIETLYLKVVQLEYLGNIIDISKINNVPENYMYNVPSEYIEEMKKFHYSPIDINNIEQYIDENAQKISKYVYLKASISKDEVRRIRASKQKVHKWINFCVRAKPLLMIDDIANELQIISFLQAIILDEQSETFNYTFHGYQNYIKHMPQVQGALKNDKYVVNALQCYWVRKVTDHWYANIGRTDVRNKVRRMEHACDSILNEILNYPNLDEMAEIHKSYLNRVDDGLITTPQQIQAVQYFESHLLNMGFRYIDNYYLIRYAFLYPPQISFTFESLVVLIDNALVRHAPLLHAELEVSSADGKDDLVVNFDLFFNYKCNDCIIQNFELNLTNIR